MRRAIAIAFLASACTVDATVAGFPCPCPDDTWECVEDACFLKEENAACVAEPPVAVKNVRVEYTTPGGAMIAWDAPTSPEPEIPDTGLYFVEVGSIDGLVTFTGVNARGSQRNDELRLNRFEAGPTRGELVGRTFVDGLKNGSSFGAKLRVVGSSCAPIVGSVSFETGKSQDPHVEGFPSFSAWLPRGEGVIDTTDALCAPAPRCLTATVSCGSTSCPWPIGVSVADKNGLDASGAITANSFFALTLRVETETPFPEVGEGELTISAGGDTPRVWRYAHLVPRTNGDTWRFEVPLALFADSTTGATDLRESLQAALHMRTMMLDYPWPNGSRIIVEQMMIHDAIPPG